MESLFHGMIWWLAFNSLWWADANGNIGHPLAPFWHFVRRGIVRFFLAFNYWKHEMTSRLSGGGTTLLREIKLSVTSLIMWQRATDLVLLLST
jgi:hypothetical protein